MEILPRNVSFLQRVEISDHVLPIGFVWKIDEHFGPVDESDRVCEELVEIGVVLGHIRILDRGGEVEPRNRAALAPDNVRKGWPDLVLTRRRRMAYCSGPRTRSCRRRSRRCLGLPTNPPASSLARDLFWSEGISFSAFHRLQ